MRKVFKQTLSVLPSSVGCDQATKSLGPETVNYIRSDFAAKRLCQI